MAAVLLIVGALLVIAGTAALSIPVAVIVTGAGCIAAGVDLRPRRGDG